MDRKNGNIVLIWIWKEEEAVGKYDWEVEEKNNEKLIAERQFVVDFFQPASFDEEVEEDKAVKSDFANEYGMGWPEVSYINGLVAHEIVELRTQRRGWFMFIIGTMEPDFKAQVQANNECGPQSTNPKQDPLVPKDA